MAVLARVAFKRGLPVGGERAACRLRAKSQICRSLLRRVLATGGADTPEGYRRDRGVAFWRGLNALDDYYRRP